MVCRIKVENHTIYNQESNKRDRTGNTVFTYNKKIWMQSYQIQVKKTKGNINQYKDYLQDIEKTYRTS